MTHADLSPIRRTSVTLRQATRLRLHTASRLLSDRGLLFSEQRLMRECLRLALRFWRGRKHIASRNRKYNQRIGPYEIVPFYSTEALRQVAACRCHHGGISVSRLMDFAVATYLARVIEYWLRFEYRGRDKDDVAVWKAKYALRLHRADFVISYAALTARNDGRILSFSEKSEILPWPPPQAMAA